ncbi:hypothetical protein BVJ53_09465 [Lacticaseibacillus chiayiensis]|uniref:Uncharacterized protein n=1 Tax=Lacticaseibacillus chiayiensis TaxID=2100821 RepID=A0A4Q1TSS5_9LACO|nr:hypothetical protein BVJ53_09465 [Lacticaseibacillus chiayiensis]RXT59410.1 hypothetical protein CHT97_00220 [Lacticaseibacillus chiayiensis]
MLALEYACKNLECSGQKFELLGTENRLNWHLRVWRDTQRLRDFRFMAEVTYAQDYSWGVRAFV